MPRIDSAFWETVKDTAISNHIIISESTANRLKLDVGDKFLVHFVEGESQRIRKFKITGIYKTGLEEYDRKFALVDIRQVQELNNWLENGAYLYICGQKDPMSIDVERTLCEIIASERNISLEAAVEILEELVAQGRFQKDVY